MSPGPRARGDALQGAPGGCGVAGHPAAWGLGALCLLLSAAAAAACLRLSVEAAALQRRVAALELELEQFPPRRAWAAPEPHRERPEREVRRTRPE